MSHVTLFFRSPTPGFYSIERVFAAILPYLRRKDWEVRKFELSHKHVSPQTILVNILAANKWQTKVNHITGDVNYLALGLHRRTLLTVHDIDSAFQGSLLRNLVVRLVWFWLPLLWVKKISVISEFSKERLVKIAPFAKNKIIVIPNPVDDAFTFFPADFNIGQPLILHVGTKPNKNLERLIDAVKGLSCKLLLIGKLSEKQTAKLDENGIKYENHFDISPQALLDCYKRSDILAFTSTYEGFGLPILEAQATGRPVLTSDIEPMRSVSGKAACLIDPFDSSSIREGILRIMGSETYRKELIERGQINASNYRAEKIADLYYATYIELSAN